MVFSSFYSDYTIYSVIFFFLGWGWRGDARSWKQERLYSIFWLQGGRLFLRGYVLDVGVNSPRTPLPRICWSTPGAFPLLPRPCRCSISLHNTTTYVPVIHLPHYLQPSQVQLLWPSLNWALRSKSPLIIRGLSGDHSNRCLYHLILSLWIRQDLHHWHWYKIGPVFLIGSFRNYWTRTPEN